MKYSIGDKVWYAEVRCIDKQVKCPECFGKKYLTVILGDDSQVTIECAGCASGYDPSRGYVHYYAWEPCVSETVIEQMEITPQEIKYGIRQSYRVQEAELFLTKEEAEIKAQEKAKQHEEEQLARIYKKEKNNRTWSWNAYYHRDCIRKAEKDLVYHTEKLNYAKIRAKEEKKTPAPREDEGC